MSALPERLILASTISCNEFSFAEAGGHFARVIFSIRKTSAECLAAARFLGATPELLAFAKAYVAMADDVTARGASARPTVKQLNDLLGQARDAIQKAGD